MKAGNRREQTVGWSTEQGPAQALLVLLFSRQYGGCWLRLNQKPPLHFFLQSKRRQIRRGGAEGCVHYNTSYAKLKPSPRSTHKRGSAARGKDASHRNEHTNPVPESNESIVPRSVAACGRLSPLEVSCCDVVRRSGTLKISDVRENSLISRRTRQASKCAFWHRVPQGGQSVSRGTKPGILVFRRRTPTRTEVRA